MSKANQFIIEIFKKIIIIIIIIIMKRGLIIFSLVLILSLSIISAFSFSDYWNENWNKITGKVTSGSAQSTITSNSCFDNCCDSSCGYGASKAIDGGLGTRWASNRGNPGIASPSNPHYLTIDLGYEYNISKFEIVLHESLKQDYSISRQHPKGDYWQEIGNNTEAVGTKEHILKDIYTARYLRVGVTYSQDNGQATVYDFKILDSNGNNLINYQENQTSQGNGTSSSITPTTKYCIDIQDTALISQYFGAEIFPPQVDLNKDGEVDILDQSILSSVFGSCQGDANYNPAYDISELINKAQSPVVSCEDSDGGINPGVYGSTGQPDSCVLVSGSAMLSTNGSCFGENCYVSEIFCGESGSTSQLIKCENGCSNGACISGPDDSTKNESTNKSFQETSCTSGCLDDGVCLPIGHRRGDLYCTRTSTMETQLGNDATCNNNFECQSNVCVDNQCIERGLFQRFLEWIKRIFG